MNMYKTSDFDYDLPPELIAKFPKANRSASRLLVVDRQAGTISHCMFQDLPHFLNPDDLVVFNNTKVIPARLRGQKASGGKLECLVERVMDEYRVLAHVRASKSPKVGGKIAVFSREAPSGSAGHLATVIARHDALFELQFDEPVDSVLNQAGEMPLPPYMDRLPEQSDFDRYQTVYAKQSGAVAAPTAGLHFDDSILKALDSKGVSRAEVTLHVGAGTFQPVRVEALSEHHMHSERMVLSSVVCQAVEKASRVVAVGTTSVRCLETASKNGKIEPYTGETDIFIYPGYEFRCVDVLLTNFHLPKSTLMMLVTAFGGYELMMRAYQEAVKGGYRFYSYGDAMLII